LAAKTGESDRAIVGTQKLLSIPDNGPLATGLPLKPPADSKRPEIDLENRLVFATQSSCNALAKSQRDSSNHCRTRHFSLTFRQTAPTAARDSILLRMPDLLANLGSFSLFQRHRNPPA
jgi:hypothetical protein